MSEALHGPLEIKSLAFGGSGVARFGGRVVFVRGAVPGDLVWVRWLREKKRFAEAEAVRFEKLSAARCEAACPVFGDCGGCQWQMLPYGRQIFHKEQIFSDILRRHCEVPQEKIRPLLESPGEWHYRSRVQFKCHALENGQLAIGFFRTGSHFVVAIDACPIADPSFNQLLPRLRQALSGTSYAHRIPQVDMEKGDGPVVRIVVHYLGDDTAGLAALLTTLELPVEVAFFLQSGRKSSLLHVSGPAELQIEVDVPSLFLAYAAGGFAQVNLEQNRRMVAEALRMLNCDAGMRALDLYCGMGNFSLPLSRRVREVVGVEDYHGSVEQGRSNAERNGLENVRFEARPAYGAYSALRGEKSFDLVVLDPPRAGARNVVTELVEQPVSRILYISCDPMTLARDLKDLLLGGYRLVESRPVDMFPQTYHLESLTLLEWGGA